MDGGIRGGVPPEASSQPDIQVDFSVGGRGVLRDARGGDMIVGTSTGKTRVVQRQPQSGRLNADVAAMIERALRQAERETEGLRRRGKKRTSRLARRTLAWRSKAVGSKTQADQSTSPSANLVASSSSTALAVIVGAPSPGAAKRDLADIAQGRSRKQKNQPTNKKGDAQMEESKDEVKKMILHGLGGPSGVRWA